MARSLAWLACLLFTIFNPAGADMTKFQWDASSSAPFNIPMAFVAANFILKGGESQYIPASSYTDNGWGTSTSSHPSDVKKNLPEKLDILFFSYPENQFYRGSFDLPYDSILKLFQTRYYSPGVQRDVNFGTIVAGIAPGGVVAVWVQGIDKSVEVFYGQAKKIDAPWSTLTSATHISREDYIRKVIAGSMSAEDVAALKKNGPPLGRWDRYRKRYAWQPEFVNLLIEDNTIDAIMYYNGEYDYLRFPLDKTQADTPRPVPRFISFVWKKPNATRGRVLKLTFNEAEIFRAFEKLGASNQPLKMEFKIEIVKGDYQFTITLYNDKERIELDHTKVENYSALH